MNRLDTIEQKILSVLTSIDGELHNTYTYYSETGQVQMFDARLSLANNTDVKLVNHYLEQQEDIGVENTEYQVGQYAYNQKVVYTIHSKLYNIGTESNAKNAIRSKMNDLIDDLLFAFGAKHTLDGQVSWINFKSAVRDYEDISNNRIQSATLITTWDVTYTQSRANPSIKSCA